MNHFRKFECKYCPGTTYDNIADFKTHIREMHPEARKAMGI